MGLTITQAAAINVIARYLTPEAEPHYQLAQRIAPRPHPTDSEAREALAQLAAAANDKLGAGVTDDGVRSATWAVIRGTTHGEHEARMFEVHDRDHDNGGTPDPECPWCPTDGTTPAAAARALAAIRRVRERPHSAADLAAFVYETLDKLDAR